MRCGIDIPMYFGAAKHAAETITATTAITIRKFMGCLKPDLWNKHIVDERYILINITRCCSSNNLLNFHRRNASSRPF